MDSAEALFRNATTAQNLAVQIRNLNLDSLHTLAMATLMLPFTGPFSGRLNVEEQGAFVARLNEVRQAFEHYAAATGSARTRLEAAFNAQVADFLEQCQRTNILGLAGRSRQYLRELVGTVDFADFITEVNNVHREMQANRHGGDPERFVPSDFDSHEISISPPDRTPPR